MNVDWSRTRAYGLGFNSLYINVKGREAWGIVPPGEKRTVMEDIAAKLREAVDPETGEPVAANVYIAEDAYKFDEQLEIGPDMVLGWTEGMRCSDASSLGKIPRELFEDNTRIWSGSHLMDPEAVPGILLTNRALKKSAPRLENLAAAVLAEFGIEEFPRRKTVNSKQ
jgi:predicted AlkP superfamily phosphohydrolase/phosphomutase